MKFNFKKKILPVILISLLFPGFHLSLSYAKNPKKVAILPFNINADRDLTFLKEGIMDMLASRLAWKGEVEILEKAEVKKRTAQLEGPIDKERALFLGKALQMDYIIMGSLTVVGEGVSIDAFILDVDKGEEVVTAFNQSKGMDDVIPTVNQFAQDINEKIMGRALQPPAPARTAETPKGPGVFLEEGERIVGKEPGRIQRFGVQIIGLDVGDVDGDGKNDLVFIDAEKVYIYKWGTTSFGEFKAIKGGWGTNYVYVSVIDLDRNGNAEIYVSNLTGDGLSSFVLEWNGSSFQEIADRQNWFFRVINVPGKGPSLIGQKRAMRDSFVGDVQYLKREGDRYVSTGPLKLHHYSNVFNFALMDLGNSEDIHSLTFGPSEFLRLFNPKEEEIWISNERYGGTYTFMESNESPERIYFSAPIVIADIDEDGQQEVMVCQNDSLTGRFVGRIRIFSSGILHFLSWDQAGLSKKWETRKQPGPIVGYRVADVDNDGLKELVIASVTKQKVTLRKPQSQVVVYELK